jgi:prolyl 4-hydroxylase
MEQTQESLNDWLNSQIARGCSAESMIEAMQAVGYSAANARNLVTNAFNGAGATSDDSLQVSSAWQKIAQKRSEINSIKPVIALDSPRLIVFDHFLSDAECDTLISLSQAKMQDSTVLDPETGQFVLHPERTSRGTYFEHQSSPVIIAIENRISQLFGFAVNQQEAIQILHYAVGREYRPHFDFFPPDETGSQQAIAEAGQRLATLIMYLNTPTEGGTTDLPNIGLSVTAKKGSAIYFENIDLQGQPNNDTLHAGTPVLAGEKWIATKWLRERALF